ncbi:peptide ABC transporter substrate-binding protein [Dictyobacter kobayashii]|uniref:Peptide ABC transporter substrate-binding protein n=1 Tax=Dictyobacter kobayashii TaxID=2014872 RepID=A0A402ABF7_9CHLR|nr:peptide ABC transporter substrate-binding protein [Dictyobacter kobayashii]GCE16425.1 peptide ABC transporter substrate-binding protein [Dictyobacter kobayashii]
MYNPFPYRHARRLSATLVFICAAVLLLAACGGGSGTMLLTNGKPTLAPGQNLTIPLVGITDVPSLNPTDEQNANTKILMNMLYSGLVRTDKNLQVVPDQATWTISADQKQYTFHLNQPIMFGDGTPVTAQTYVDSWTYAARPSNQSPLVASLMYAIVGARDVHEGHTKTLAGIKAIDDQTIEVTLTKPAPYFLAALTNPLFVPINQKVVHSYSRNAWSIPATEQGIGTGPFIVKDITHDVDMTLVPNPHYYGKGLIIKQVTVYFENDPRVAYTANRAGHYDLVWDLAQQDQLPAVKLAGFERPELLQTDALFFDTTSAPFDSVAVRQAFARSLDKQSFAQVAMQNSVAPANTLLPPAMPGYQAQASSFSPAKAQEQWKTAAKDGSLPSTVTFTYPYSQVSPTMAQSLQSMWQKALGIQVNLRPLEDMAYQQALASHSIQFGFISWTAEVADPYFFMKKFLSDSQQNVSQWHNPAYDQLIARADSSSTDQRLALYHEAEQQILSDAVIIPLDHQRLAGLIPDWLQGVSLNAEGLYFGDWSNIAILNHKQ